MDCGVSAALTQSTLPRRPQPGVPVPGVAQSSDLQILLNFKASQTNQVRVVGN